MSKSLVEPSVLANVPANCVSTKEVLDGFCRHLGIDPQTLPNADSLPPWTEEEAAAFTQVIDDAFEQVEEV